MRAAIAIRVSPRPQENVRYSPEIQEQVCREWCEREGHEVVTVVQDILVSGGSRSRFDSIFAAVEQHTPDIFVVSDLSRWTRDKPSRFWAIKALLEDQGVQLVSVTEPWLDNGQPFGDTITTAVVEGNYQERMRLKAKTSAGVRKAWAAGKRWGSPFGWTFDQMTRQWSQDVERITRFYTDWAEGVTAWEMSSRYHMQPQNVKRVVAARCQREVVGDELWERANRRTLPRVGRRDAKRSSLYAGLLVCPFCGNILTQRTHWGHYGCHKVKASPHGWFSVSARVFVTPGVSELLQRLQTPEVPVVSTARTKPEKGRDWQKELDRLSMAWVKGRLSDAAYERAVADIEVAREGQHAPPEPEDKIEFVRSLSIIDLEDRNPETGRIANLLLRELIERIEIGEDKTASIIPYPWIEEWMDTAH